MTAGLAVTLGCGGGEGGGGTLQLVQTVPADMATEVSTDIVVTAEFETALNEATVTTSSFTLTLESGADVEGSVAVTGQTASLTPARPLGLLRTYTATLTTAIEGVSGETLAMNETWGFQTRDGQWGEPVLIEIRNAGSARFPRVALDPNGNAVAVWAQWDGTRRNIWANRFTPSAGWGVAEPIETDNVGDAFSPQVALDPNGNAVAVWRQYDGTRFNIWANRFKPAAGWGVAEPIETDDAGDASSPQVGVDPNGNAVAVWNQDDGTRDNIWANRFE
ncbi:MAG: Ig-like domain-containing protein [Myxococcales bacterium]|nr:Ig-like domain-containing protein [Myxococcales bacterium]